MILNIFVRELLQKSIRLTHVKLNNKNMKRTLLFFITTICCAIGTQAKDNHTPRFSTAGFYAIENSGRTVHSMNPAWRFFKGDALDAASVDFDDSRWLGVNLPNGMELLPLEASGGVNYRGPVWYRKHFQKPTNLQGKRLVLYFEAVMGKCKVWVNGEQVAEHFGGFTPISIDVTDAVKDQGDNVIAVWADNSDDPTYPPGKPQAVLDFCYFGGIYRDVWLVATSKELYITDPNEVDKVAGGGIFVSYSSVSESSAHVKIIVDVDGAQSKVKGKIECELIAPDGTSTAKIATNVRKGENTMGLTIASPALWSPEQPNLYMLNIKIKNSKGEVVDAMAQRLGVRSIDFSYSKGLILNGKPYPRKLIGANRHQDFAVIGNALSNNLHYRDAKKLKEAGLEIIRNAHYPQDPAFMDVCDELGLFVIVNTPGWQFWNAAPIFEQRVYTDIRTMVRRDRNHPSVLMWEPILNETSYPEAFAQNTHNIVKQESPYKGTNFTAADDAARGSKYFDIIFCHPRGGGVVGDDNSSAEKLDTTKVYFTREWGDNVDDWNSHNSPSRVARQWGEVPQLVQALHYAAPQYPYTSYQVLQEQPPCHFGGTLWHSFDHQRGYHPDPFYGGIMDAFRRPKFSYYMFQAQAAAGLVEPMVYIANEFTPFSPKDVTVFSNCASVRLTTFFGDDSVRVALKKRRERWFTFDNAWSFMQDKALSRSGKQRSAYLVAEGLDDNGRVVATTRGQASRRPAKLLLTVDTMDAAVVADGGDLVVVTASMVDRWGNVKRLNNEYVHFSIEGPGTLMSSAATLTNPTALLWGEASVLVRATTMAGQIKVKASVLLTGQNTPIEGEVVFSTHQSATPLLYDSSLKVGATPSNLKSVHRIDRKQIEQTLQEVESQQTIFGEDQ